MSRNSLTTTARMGLREIWDHIAKDNPGAADKLLDRIDDRFRPLSGNPLLDEMYQEVQRSMRFSIVGRYVIFYEPIASGVRVLRVLHGVHDLPSILGQLPDDP